MRTLIRFIREAWPLVRRRKTMSAEAYERAKDDLIARYVLGQEPEATGGRSKCFVAVMRHGHALTISGVADFLDLERDREWKVDDFGVVRARPDDGLTLTIHLYAAAVQESRQQSEGMMAE